MLRPKHRTLFRLASLFVATSLVLTLALPGLPVFAQTTREITPAVVLPVVDDSGAKDPLVAQKATDALAMALENSGNYRVIARTDLDRTLKTLELNPPLNTNEQLRVGSDLQAERVITATLRSLALNPGDGQVRVSLDLRSLDVTIGQLLNGAAVEVVTKPIPGYRGDSVAVINEALREVSEKAVTDMEKSLRRHGSVTLVDDESNVTTDLGVDDGIGIGTHLAVMRGFYLKDLDKTVMRNIGTLEIRSAQVRLSTARSLDGDLPRIGDRVYPLYSPPEEARSVNQGREVTKSLQVIAGLALLLGIVATAVGNQSGGAPTDLQANIFQQMPGATPVDRVFIHRGLNPDPEHTHDWLLFRGTDSGFPAQTDLSNYLVYVVKGGHIDYIDDDISTTFDIPFADTFTYVDNGGAAGSGTVTITYNHFGVTPGNVYFYKVRRVVDPYRPNVPVPAQIVPVVPVTTVTPPDALSEQSAAAGPLTFSLPATASHPLLTDPPQPQTGATFEWVPSLGADQYQVQIYADPLLTQLVISSPVLTSTGNASMSYTFSTFTLPANASGSTTLYWVVGSRTSFETNPQCLVGTKTVPFILSAGTAFHTVQAPPPPVSGSAVLHSGRPNAITDFWGARHLHP